MTQNENRPKAQFTSQPMLRVLPQNEVQKLGLPRGWWAQFQKDFSCFTTIIGAIVIPAGLVTYSSERIGYKVYPGYIHEMLYYLKGQLPGRSLTRKVCDEILIELMLAEGASIWRQLGTYYCWRWFGWFVWGHMEAQYQIAEKTFGARGVPLGEEPD